MRWGYVNETAMVVRDGALRPRLDSFRRRSAGQALVKVNTSGNFYDDHELSPTSRKDLLQELGDRCDKVIVETLSHMIRREQVEEALESVDHLEVAFGLESTNDRVLRYGVNKMWGLREHARPADHARRAGG